MKKIVLLGIIGIYITAAGCQSGNNTHSTAAPHSEANSVVSQPSIHVPREEQQVAATTVATPAPNFPTHSPSIPIADSNGCPTTVDDLAAALRASGSSEYSKIPDLMTLKDPECYQSFATVRSEPQTDGQGARILFGYSAETKVWRPLNIGSAEYCAGYVPDAIATHFTGCG